MSFVAAFESKLVGGASICVTGLAVVIGGGGGITGVLIAGNGMIGGDIFIYGCDTFMFGD